MREAVPPHEPRLVCDRCRRPARVCYCAELPTLPTPNVRVLLLQHPRERDMAIGTARMASLCLPDSELWIGADWSASPALDRALSDPARPAGLLYPGANARDITRDPPKGPVTLVVIDGTWANTKKVLRTNPNLGALPRWAFTPDAPSEYRIRREPHEAFVSTIEALVHVLGAFDEDPDRFRALLRPFRFMVDMQIAHAEGNIHPRERYLRRRVPLAARDRLPRALFERAEDIVVVSGEANAWPYDEGTKTKKQDDELVHWVACRPSTGETFEAIVAPRGGLAEGTCRHIGVSQEELAAGISLEELHARWRAFVRPRDIVASWGEYGTSIFAACGGWFPEERLDLRRVAHVFANARVGALAAFAAKLESRESPAKGRAGARIAQLTAVARHFARLGGSES